MQGDRMVNIQDAVLMLPQHGIQVNISALHITYTAAV